MKKLAPILALTVLVLAACGAGTGAVAATVNGVDITVGDIESLIDSGDDSTIAKETFAQFLGFEIQQRIVTAAAEEELGIVISEDEISSEADSIFEEANVDGVTREEFLTNNEITEQLLLKVAQQQLLDAGVREALTADVAEPTQEEIDAMIAEAEAQYCASHILVATEPEADAVLDRIEAGEEFADLATELSTDTGSGAQGGDLGCAAPDGYVTEFAEALTAAEEGVPTEPVETEFGFHIILVRADEIPTEDEILEQLRTVAIGTATNDWFLGHVESAEVTVDESYGTWEASPTPQVVPPTE